MQRFLLLGALLAFATGSPKLHASTEVPPLLVSSDDNAPEEKVISEPRAVAAPAISEAAAQTQTETVASPSDSSATQWIWVGPGVAVYNGSYGNILGKGNVGLATNLSWMTLASNSLPLYIGIDGALYLWNSQVNNIPVAGTGIQVLPTALYRFSIGAAPDIHPYLGLAMGPHVYVGQSASGNTQAVFMEFLVRPGVQWQLNSSFALNFEPKIGVLNSDFISIPQLTATLAL